jgi:hypothetical protein
VDQLTKGTMVMMHRVALLKTEVASLRNANEGLSKRRRAKRTRVELGRRLAVQDAREALGQEAVSGEGVQETQLGGSGARGVRTTVRCCGVCGKPGHKARTCQDIAEASDSAVSDVQLRIVIIG